MSASSPREYTPSGNAPGGEIKTRFDPPHVLAATPEDRSAPPAKTDAEADGAATTSEQIQTQAAQLAEHLRSRQREVDHREALLNAQIARFEADARSARLMLREREAALAEQEQSLGERFVASGDSDATAHDRRRQQRLEAAEAALADARTETERLRQSLLDDRRQFEEQVRAERERAAAEWRRRLADVDAKRQTLARQSESVDQCRASLEQLRGELIEMHRETLEIRLATEELWGQLAGSASPAALARSLGELRERLADAYRLSGAELDKRKRELVQVGRDLSRQREQLAAAQRDLERCTQHEREEFQRQTQRLREKEQELDRRQAQLNDQARQWQSRELDYRDEIRRLRAMLHESGASLAAA